MSGSPVDFYLVHYTEDFGENCGAFARVDDVVVEDACLLQHGALLQAEKRIATGCEQNGGISNINAARVSRAAESSYTLRHLSCIP